MERKGTNDYWIVPFITELAQEFRDTGRAADAERLTKVFQILNGFFSSVHVPVAFYDANTEGDNTKAPVAVITGKYTIKNSNTVSVVCIPGAMITNKIMKAYANSQGNSTDTAFNGMSDRDAPREASQT